MTNPELEKGFQEIWKLFAETDRKVEKMWAETKEMFKETDRQFKETDKRIKEVSVQMKETDKRFQKLTDKWGEFVEGLVSPAAIKLFSERGIEIERITQRFKVSKNGKEGMEIDILGINREYVVLIEVKSTLGIQDVKDHLKRMDKFKTYFPEYKERKVVGAVAGIVIKKNTESYAFKQGLFVIAQSGDMVMILNDINFKPKEW
ncbi:MAG: DUF3782 domain-containing protein [Candidatus Omnitrophota bacterium]|jgi:hypothetical protein|nr:MAG: DUF3782 domain-containing protein [Candidatus Omnitrophota bacterium]